jgi:hypothetical protein
MPAVGFEPTTPGNESGEFPITSTLALRNYSSIWTTWKLPRVIGGTSRNSLSSNKGIIYNGDCKGYSRNSTFDHQYFCRDQSKT